MLDNGYKVNFYDQLCQIVDESGVEIMAIKMMHISFPLVLKESEHNANRARLDNSNLWHRRLGHFNYVGLSKMSSQEIIVNLPSMHCPDKVCKVCEMGKSSRSSVPSKFARGDENKLEIIHSDVCGPMSID